MTARHSWVKLKLHNYLCRKCGTGKRNTQVPDGSWFTTYYRAAGEVVVPAVVPRCEPGKLTAERLEWLRNRKPAAEALA